MVYVIENIVFFLQHDHLGITDFLPEYSTVMKYIIDPAEIFFSRRWIQMEEILGEAYCNVRENRSNQGINHISKISDGNDFPCGTMLHESTIKFDVIRCGVGQGKRRIQNLLFFQQWTGMVIFPVSR